jgi:hypothetical protein
MEILRLVPPCPTSSLDLAEMFNVRNSPFKHMGLLTMDRMRAEIVTKAQALHEDAKKREPDAARYESLRVDLRRYFPMWHVFSTHAENSRSSCDPAFVPEFSWLIDGIRIESSVMRCETICIALLYGCVSFTLAELLAEAGKPFAAHHYMAFRLFEHVCLSQAESWLLDRTGPSPSPPALLEESCEALKCTTALALQRRALIAAKRLDGIDVEQKALTIASLAAWGLESINSIAGKFGGDHKLRIASMRPLFLSQFLLANAVLRDAERAAREAAVLATLARSSKGGKTTLMRVIKRKPKGESAGGDLHAALWKSDEETERAILAKSPTLDGTEDPVAALKTASGHFYLNDRIDPIEDLGLGEEELRHVFDALVG